MTALTENTEMLWNLIIERMKEQFHIDIQTNSVCRRRFQEIVESTYEQMNTFKNVMEMNKNIISQLSNAFQTTMASQKQTSSLSEHLSSAQRQVIHCAIDENTHNMTHHTNLGHIKQLCCKTLEFHDCCVSTHTNEFQMIQKRFLHDYLVMFLDIYINNQLVGKNIILTQQQQMNKKILFTSDEYVPYNDICTKIQFVLKDADMNPIVLQYNVTILTMISGPMLTLGDSVPAKLKEPIYFSFLINTGDVQIGDILMLNDKEIHILATGSIDIQDKQTITVTELTDKSPNAFFCCLDNKFKLPDIPNKIIFKNKSRKPTLCIEYS